MENKKTLTFMNAAMQTMIEAWPQTSVTMATSLPCNCKKVLKYPNFYNILPGLSGGFGDISDINPLMQMPVNIFFAQFDVIMRICFLAGLSRADFIYQSAEFEFYRTGKMLYRENVIHVFDFTDKHIAHGKCFLRNESSLDGSSGGERVQRDRKILRMPYWRVREIPKIFVIIFSNTLLQSLQIPLPDTIHLPELLLIRTVKEFVFQVVEEKL